MRSKQTIHFALLIATAAIFALSSCAGSGPSPRGSYDASHIEFLTRDEVVREDVENHPRQFEVTQAERPVLWKRVKILSKEQVNTGSPLNVIKAPSMSGFHVRHFPGSASSSGPDSPKATTSSKASGKQFAYEILARPKGANTLLVEVAAVNTTTGQPDIDSDLLARNIARFLKSGIFERSLL